MPSDNPRSILNPVDFSEQSRHALRWAAAFAARFGSRLTVVSVVDPLLAEAARVRLGQDLAKEETEPALREFVASTWTSTTRAPTQIVFRTRITALRDPHDYPSPQPPASSTGDTPSPVPPPSQAPQQPWRTEGLPPRQPKKPRLRRSTIAIWLVGYLLLFGVLTVQDRLAGPQPVPYTEFKNQVTSKNVATLFARGDSIQGELKKAAAVPGPAGSDVSAVFHRAADVRDRRPAHGVDCRRCDRAGDATRRAARVPRQPADLLRTDSAARGVLRVDVPAPARGDGRHPGRRKTEACRSRDRPRHL